MNTEPTDAASAASNPTLSEVRYSLPKLLAEIKTERAHSTFSMEKLDQTEIGKLFKAKAPRRAKSKK